MQIATMQTMKTQITTTPISTGESIGAVFRRSGHRGVLIRVTATVESNPDGRKILMGCTVTYTIGGCVLFDVGGYGKKIKMADVFHRYVEVWSNGFESHPRDYESYLIVYRDMSFINREARLRELHYRRAAPQLPASLRDVHVHVAEKEVKHAEDARRGRVVLVTIHRRWANHRGGSPL